MKKLLVLAGSIVLSVVSAFGQTVTPGGVALPEGFRYESRRGIDSSSGAFIRSDGFSISHDIGKMAGNYADQYFPEYFERLRKQTHRNEQSIERQISSLQEKVAWRRRQKVNGADVMVVMLKDSTLITCFVAASANFIAIADTPDKIADYFLIVLNFQPNTGKAG